MGKSIIIVGVIIGFMSLFGIGNYNSLKSAQIEVENQYSQVENQIQRRADLIPNLISTVKGYMQYEEKVLNEVTEARTKVMQADNIHDKIEASVELTSALNRLIAVSENYPDLKANTQFTELMREIAGSENRIAVARRDFNNAVRNYNLETETFPGNIFSGIFGFIKMKAFEADESAHEVPKVEF